MSDYATANTARLEAYRKRTAPVYAADPQTWDWRVKRGERFKAWLRSHTRAGNVVQLDAERVRRVR